MRTHRKPTSQERDKIAYWYAVGESLREMARRLGRSPSGISEEIKRNTVDGRYHSIRAHQASEARKYNSHKKYRLKTRPTLQSYVVEKLGLGWSPLASMEVVEIGGKRSAGATVNGSGACPPRP